MSEGLRSMSWLWRGSARAVIAAGCLLVAGCAASGGGAAAGSAPVSAGSATASPVPAGPSAPSVVPSPADDASASPTVPVPVLGVSRGVTRGYGSARPSSISNGGDPTGVVTDLTWESWGQSRAVGTGTAYYDPPGVPVAEATPERATVVAFDLGTCSGRYMYQAIEWYFPESGQAFSVTAYIDICSWTYRSAPALQTSPAAASG
jgi:hypothetical protein